MTTTSPRRRRRARRVALVAAGGLVALVVSAGRPATVQAAPVTGEAIVRLAPLAPGTSTTVAEAAALVAERHGGAVTASIASVQGLVLVTTTDGRTSEALADEIDLDPAVDRASPNSPVQTAELVTATGRVFLWAAAPADAVTSQYAPSLLQLPGAIAASGGGVGVTVAVVDSGVQLRPTVHPDLAGALVAGYDVVDDDAVPDDEATGLVDPVTGAVDAMAGHGTHVAGIVRLTAPSARIMPVRALDATGTGTVWNVLRGAYWAADHGASVVNLSLGLHGSAGSLKDLSADLQARGVVVVAAAGNDGRDRDNYPAAADCTVSVTATAADDAIASYATTGTKVRLAAPGDGIVSAFPFTPTGHASWSGSSMAAPFAAGTAALLRSVDPTLRPGEVLVTLAGTAAPVTTTIGTVEFGRLDPLRAVQAVRSGKLPTALAAGVDPECLG